MPLITCPICGRRIEAHRECNLSVFACPCGFDNNTEDEQIEDFQDNWQGYMEFNQYLESLCK